MVGVCVCGGGMCMSPATRMKWSGCLCGVKPPYLEYHQVQGAANRLQKSEIQPLFISGDCVERVSDFRFLASI